jgi:hypothetical protein
MQTSGAGGACRSRCRSVYKTVRLCREAPAKPGAKAADRTRVSRLPCARSATELPRPLLRALCSKPSRTKLELMRGLEPRSTAYEAVALPVELHQLIITTWSTGRDSNTCLQLCRLPPRLLATGARVHCATLNCGAAGGLRSPRPLRWRRSVLPG